MPRLLRLDHVGIVGAHEELLGPAKPIVHILMIIILIEPNITSSSTLPKAWLGVLWNGLVLAGGHMFGGNIGFYTGCTGIIGLIRVRLLRPTRPRWGTRQLDSGLWETSRLRASNHVDF